jgi:hypothetical protein
MRFNIKQVIFSVAPNKAFVFAADNHISMHGYTAVCDLFITINALSLQAHSYFISNKSFNLSKQSIFGLDKVYNSVRRLTQGSSYEKVVNMRF